MNADIWYVDDRGTEWRLCDSAVVNGRHIVLPFGSDRAEYRIFVGGSGYARVYAFAKRELRGAQPRHVERQLRESSPLAPGALDPALELQPASAERR